MLSGYRFLWIQVLFDLPVVEFLDRKEAITFRNTLLNLGFQMAQYSVYQRYVSSKESAESLIRSVESSLPSGGKVHILIFTDKQYENMKTFVGKKWKKTNNPDQYELF